MQPRSALFDATVSRPHTVLVSADVLAGGKVIASGLPVSGGTVDGNRAQFARQTCTVAIGDPAYIPTGAPGDLLAPYGNELRVWRGAITPAGPELMCLGTFGIRSVSYEVGVAFKGVMVTGLDRCKRLAETRFPYPRTSQAQVSAINQVITLISEVVPYAEIRVDPRLLDQTLPQVTWRSDRDKAIADIMSSLGGEIFCDPYGAFVLQPIPAPSGAPVFTVQGGDGGVLVGAQPTVTRDGVFNGVLAYSSTTNVEEPPIVSDLMIDDDPTSPTFWGGNFGKVVGYYESSLLTDYTQANTAARALLLNQIGAARSINYSQLVNAAVELGDIGLVVNPDTGIAERHLHDQLTVPLEIGGVMTAQTRSTTSPDPVFDPNFSGVLS